ncbi:hypothetical protein AB0F44_16630, partial [Nocardioides sp. NPDC023903]|uniref:hypothetical protein n=1 Tax=Nocardioides sp. NPDC023903 TaxID=3157195 RepID=UPI0034086709
IGSMGHLLKGESPNLSLCPVYLRPLVAACLADEPTRRRIPSGRADSKRGQARGGRMRPS